MKMGGIFTVVWSIGHQTDVTKQQDTVCLQGQSQHNPEVELE